MPQRKDQYINRFKNAGLSQQQLEKKWQARLEEEKMFEARALENLRNQALFTSVGRGVINTPSPPPPPPGGFGTGPFTFDFDTVVFEYFFTDGSDMDTMTYISNPAIMHDDFANSLPGDYVGTCAFSSNGPQFPASPATPYLIYGGDNTGTGTEATLFDLAEFKTQRPSDTSIEISFTATWYGTPGLDPVIMRATMWKGGSAVASGYTFENPTASASRQIQSTGTVITSNTQNCEAFELVSKFQFNTATFAGAFV